MGIIKNNYPIGGRNFKHGRGFQNRCPVCGTKEPIVLFSTHEIEPNLGRDLKIKKYHEVVNNASMDIIVRAFSGERTPRS